MSRNDLILRGEVEDILCDAYDGTIDEGALAYLISELKKIPAVPREMSAREFIYAFQKMCKNIQCCPKCLLYGLMCGKFDTPISDIEEAVAIVEAWAREHPEERSEE